MSTPKGSKLTPDTKIHMIEEDNSGSKNQSLLNIVNSINKNDENKQPFNNKRYSKDSEYNFQNDQNIINYNQNQKDTYLPFSLNNINDKKYDYTIDEMEKYTNEANQQNNNQK